VVSKTERVARLTEATRLGRLLRRLGTWNGIVVFTYHRVAYPDPAYDADLWDASPPMFEAQLQFLAREFDVIGIEDVESAVGRGRGRYVLLTFDDGYRDNFTEAFPLLERLRLPATFFVASGFLDGREISWWDEIAWMVHASRTSELVLPDSQDRPLSLRPAERRRTVKSLINQYKRLSPAATAEFLARLGEATGSGRHGRSNGHQFWMTWDDVRKLRAAGMQIGGHTATHQRLAQLSPDEQDAEIALCKQRLESELGERMRWFSYPDGGRDSFDDATRRCLEHHDVELAFSFYGGYRTFRDWDRLDVRRRCLGPSVSLQRFALMLTLPQVFAWR
jgi:peptidoglycan/xylan/chitin deacetylase (PgdA/CDA1 family)